MQQPKQKNPQAQRHCRWERRPNGKLEAVWQTNRHPGSQGKEAPEAD